MRFPECIQLEPALHPKRGLLRSHEMKNRLVLIVRLAGLLLAGTLALPAGAAPGLPLTDPFGVRFAPAPVRVAPIQGRVLRALRVQHLGSLKFSPDGRSLAFSRTVILRSLPNSPSPDLPLGEVRLLDVRSGRVSTLLSTTQTRKVAAYSGLVSEMWWVDRRRLKASIFNGDDEFTIFTVDVPSRKVVDETGVGIGIPEPTPPRAKARERARTLFPNLDKALLEDYAWGYAYLDGDRGVLLQKPTKTTDNTVVPGDVWFLDFRRHAARHLIAFREPDALIAGAVTVGESTLFLLAGPRRARVFRYQGDRLEPLIELRTHFAWMSPLFVTSTRAYFVLWWRMADLTAPANEPPPPRAALYAFDGRTLQRSNDYPSLFGSNIDLSGRLVALAYRTKMADRLVVAELAR